MNSLYKIEENKINAMTRAYIKSQLSVLSSLILLDLNRISFSDRTFEVSSSSISSDCESSLDFGLYSFLRLDVKIEND